MHATSFTCRCHDDGSLAAKPHLSVRAQQRAVQKEKDALALAQFGKPYRELEHQKKLMMSKLWCVAHTIAVAEGV